MPCRYDIDKDRRLVISTGWDRLPFAEAKARQDQLGIDPDFNSEFNQTHRLYSGNLTGHVD